MACTINIINISSTSVDLVIASSFVSVLNLNDVINSQLYLCDLTVLLVAY